MPGFKTSNKYGEDIQQKGISEERFGLMRRLGTPVGLQKVKTLFIEGTLKRTSGMEIRLNYRGKKVLSAYRPLHLFGLDWGLITEIEVAETHQLFHELKLKLFTASMLFLLMVSLLAAFFSNVFVRPIRYLIEGTKKICAGELDTKVPITAKDEFGKLAGALWDVVDKFKKNQQELEIQKQKNDAILVSLLPETTAKRFKEGDDCITDESDQVTFLYVHVVGIADLSKSISTKEAIKVLTKLFNEFDEATERYEMDRQTSSNADYIAVCGLSRPNLDHTKRTVDLALAMLEILERLGFNYNPLLGLHMAIHSGSAKAGIVGTRKRAYMLWGEDLYLTSQLSSKAEPNSVVVTENVYKRMKDKFVFIPKTAIDIKGVGEVKSWTLVTTPKLEVNKVQLVQSSFASVVPIAEQAAELFYNRLFELDPNLRALFKGDMKKQQRKVMDALGVAVQGFSKPEEMVPTIQGTRATTCWPMALRTSITKQSLRLYYGLLNKAWAMHSLLPFKMPGEKRFYLSAA